MSRVTFARLACFAIALLVASPLLEPASAQIACDGDGRLPIYVGCFPTQTTSTPMRADATSDDTGTDTGDDIVDVAHVTSTQILGKPTGTVTFHVCAVDVVPCATGGTLLGTKDLVDENATSDPFTTEVPGRYCFRAEYSGDQTYAPSSDASEGECLLITPDVTPTKTVSTPSRRLVDTGEGVTDKANVTALPFRGVPGDEKVPPSGNVTFYVCAVDVVPCASGGKLLGNGTIVDGNATSPIFVPTVAGRYCFRAEYDGDDDHEFAPSQDASRGECFRVLTSVPFFPTPGSLAMGLVGSAVVVLAVVRSRRTR